MINYVSGILGEISGEQIVVEAGGIGYGIFVTSASMAMLPPVGSEIKVYTHLAVSDDAQTLYGFLYRDELDMFKKLIRVNGVGPKGALSILGVLSADELRLAIAVGDAASISRAQGIGKKTAERVILDLKDKVGTAASPDIGAAGTAGIRPGEPGYAYGPTAEAIEALSMLGYSRIEAARAVSLVELSADMDTEEILRAALKNIKL